MSRPNVLFIVLDAVRIDHCSTYGYERETTPAMTDLALDGVRYDHAFAPSIWTPTVHGAVFTGKYPSHTGIYGNSLGIPEDSETIVETLQKCGYRTFAASAGAHIRRDRGYARGVDDYVETRRIGLDVDFFGKVLTDPSYARQVGFTLTRGPDDKTRYKFDRLHRFIGDAIDADDPFFGFINAKTAHQPFYPPRPYKELFCDGFERPRWEFLERTMDAAGFDSQRLPGWDMQKLRTVSNDGGDGVLVDEIDMSDDEWGVIESWYDGAIRYVDDLVGDLMAYLRSNGEYDDTLVVVAADHGDNFGDRGLTSHVFCLYDTLVHVPLVIKPPRALAQERGTAIDAQVSLVDLHPSILEAAGASHSEYAFASSLLDFEDRQYHEYTFAEYAGYDGPIERLRRKYPDADVGHFARPLQSIRDEEYKLIVTGGETEEFELYAWRDDPGETRNLIEERPERADELFSDLREHFPPLDTSGTFETPDDPELEAQLEDLGYL